MATYFSDKLALKIISRQFNWFKNRHPYPFVWNEYFPYLKDRFILNSIMGSCKILSDNSIDFRQNLSAIFKTSYQKYKNLDSSLNQEVDVDWLFIEDALLNNFTDNLEIINLLFEEDPNYIQYVFEPLLNDCQKYFNEDFVQKLIKNGNSLTDNSSPLMVMGKFLLKSDEFNLMYYPYAILPNDYSHFQSIVVKYDETHNLETQDIYLRAIIEVKEVRNEISTIENILQKNKNSVIIYTEFKPILANGFEFISEIEKYTVEVSNQ